MCVLRMKSFPSMTMKDKYNCYIEDFLDFTLDDLKVEEEEEEEDNKAVFRPVFDDCSSTIDIDNSPVSQLCVPDDPIEDLEWFPSFTDDLISLSGLLTTPECNLDGFPSTPELKHENPKRRKVWKDFDGFGMKVAPRKRPRSKRDYVRPVQSFNDSEFSPWWENNKVLMRENSNLMGRRCTHCQTDRTPLWRSGPTGPKTLCNACGVRYKSGRLVPEYRPVASPSFNSKVHSNSHRKIMKMKMKREG